jgi:hypothetical protein
MRNVRLIEHFLNLGIAYPAQCSGYRKPDLSGLRQRNAVFQAAAAWVGAAFEATEGLARQYGQYGAAY